MSEPVRRSRARWHRSVRRPDPETTPASDGTSADLPALVEICDPACPGHTVAGHAASADERVRHLAWIHPNCPPALLASRLAELLEHRPEHPKDAPDDLRWVLTHRALPYDSLRMAVADDWPYVVGLAMTNAGVDDTLVATACSHRRAPVRHGMVDHALTTDDQQVQFGRDASPMVRDAARDRRLYRTMCAERDWPAPDPYDQWVEHYRTGTKYPPDDRPGAPTANTATKLTLEVLWREDNEPVCQGTSECANPADVIVGCSTPMAGDILVPFCAAHTSEVYKGFVVGGVREPDGRWALGFDAEYLITPGALYTTDEPEVVRNRGQRLGVAFYY